MACILHIETSAGVSSVAVSADGFTLYERVDRDGRNHSERLGAYLDEAMSKIEEKRLTLHAVSVSAGPGSYTGLRVGVSMAKGLCYGADAKLIGLPTLEVLCVPLLLSDRVKFITFKDGERLNGEGELEDDALLCPMVDARRMEVFAAVYDRSLKPVRATAADIVDAETYREYLDKRIVYFFGDGAEKCLEVINHPNARLVKGVEALAKNMIPLADMRYHKGAFEDTAYFTPEYIKTYEAKKPKDLLKGNTER